MLVVLADTHGRRDHRLEGRTREAVRAADRVVHAGDFRTERVLDAFERACAAAGAAFDPVYGNNDPPGIRERVPAERTVEYGGLRFAVVHGHEHGETTLPLLGRGADADCVIVGHSHRPEFGEVGGVPVLNPGSHADPRAYRPAHAELEALAGPASDDADAGPALGGRLVTPDGETIDRFRLGSRS